MALIDEPWSRHEVAEAIVSPAHSEQPAARRRLAAALMCSKDEAARRRGRQLMPASRVRPSDAVGYTFDEVVEANLEREFSAAIDEVRDQVKQLDLRAIAEAHQAQN